MDPRAIATTTHGSDHLARLVALVTRTWNKQHWRLIADGTAPDAAWFGAKLEEAVRDIAREPAVAAALATLYPHWISQPCSASPPIDVPFAITDALIAIENRYCRSLTIAAKHEDQLACLRRQAALVDRLDRSTLAGQAFDHLFESILETDTDVSRHEVGPSSLTWAKLAHSCEMLKGLPEARQVLRLPLRPSEAALEATREYSDRTAAAVAVAPPRIWRFYLRSEQVSEAYVAALSAPRLAGWLVRHLTRWERLGNLAPFERESITQSRTMLSQRLGDWLDRSVPRLDPGIDLDGRLSRWSKHLLRSRLVGAQVWRREWFEEQLAEALKVGQALAAKTNARPTSLARYVTLRIVAYQCGYAAPGGELGSHLNEAERIASDLDPDAFGLFLERLKVIQAANIEPQIPRQLARLIWGEIASDPNQRKRAEKLLESKLADCKSELGCQTAHNIDPRSASNLDPSIA